MTRILVGTSGWTHAAWAGTVYPASLPRGEWLTWYAARFPAVEVASTYHRVPARDEVASWATRTRGSPGFELSVKAPATLTEVALALARPEDVAQHAAEWADAVAAPLATRGRLGAILMQLPPSLRCEAVTLARLDAALDALDAFDVAVEFRHRSWVRYDGRLRDAARRVLEAWNAAPVVTDSGVTRPVVDDASVSHAYVRMAHAPAWPERVAALAEGRTTVRAFALQYPAGRAFADAVAVMARLPQASLAERVPAQSSLDAFPEDDAAVA